MQANGSFEVRLEPQPPAPGIAEAGLGRMHIDKQYRGDLDARGLGEMLGFRSETPGSAGYVAMERVSGTLHGRRGSFVLQHNGTMDRGASSQRVTVVPDSGTGELRGLNGAMVIRIESGQHFYAFDYALS